MTTQIFRGQISAASAMYNTSTYSYPGKDADLTRSKYIVKLDEMV